MPDFERQFQPKAPTFREYDARSITVTLVRSREKIMFGNIRKHSIAALVAILMGFHFAAAMGETTDTPQVRYRTVEIDGLDIFYRAARRKPTGAP